MTNYEIKAIQLIKENPNITLTTDQYVNLCRAYLLDKKLIRDEGHFNALINNDTEWGMTHHQLWSVKGADLIVYGLTHGKYFSFREMVLKED